VRGLWLIEDLARLLLAQLLRCQFAEFVVAQGQELLGGVGIALLDGGDNLGDVLDEAIPSHQENWSLRLSDRSQELSTGHGQESNRRGPAQGIEAHNVLRIPPGLVDCCQD
jgi:hypothetical protein